MPLAPLTWRQWSPELISAFPGLVQLRVLRLLSQKLAPHRCKLCEKRPKNQFAQSHTNKRRMPLAHLPWRDSSTELISAFHGLVQFRVHRLFSLKTGHTHILTLCITRLTKSLSGPRAPRLYNTVLKAIFLESGWLWLSNSGFKRDPPSVVCCQCSIFWFCQFFALSRAKNFTTLMLKATDVRAILTSVTRPTESRIAFLFKVCWRISEMQDI